jgi:hypothetical protein
MFNTINTIQAHSIVWDVLNRSASDAKHRKHGAIVNIYCCDGDGIVQVYKYQDGVFSVFDQGTYRGKFSTLDEALGKAAKILKKDYQAIYEMFVIED